MNLSTNIESFKHEFEKLGKQFKSVEKFKLSILRVKSPRGNDLEARKCLALVAHLLLVLDYLRQ